ncbi:hypothetical protein [Epilithonimonas tenax]|uniref:hypothetical protein n=1 Tax=Epilithonimonas tenax TaxID=191577 RepID=UPI000404EE19|nr:hypothetical protein [Epilithonimonas tenax]
MENQKHNQESTSNGIELLENVIKSNENSIASNNENIENSVKLRFDLEDLLSAFKHTQAGLKSVNQKYSDLMMSYKIEQAKRSEFLATIPTKVETTISQQTIDFYENFERKLKSKERLVWSGFGALSIGIFIFILSITFANNWYKESIKAKSELRQDILNQIDAEGKKIYEKKEISSLTDNIRIMNLWIKNNPEDAQNFMRFKQGYLSGK